MNEKITIPSKEHQDAHIAMWEDQFDMQTDETLPTGDAALEAARARNETQTNSPEVNERELSINSPAQTVETQATRITDMSDFVPYSELSTEQAVEEINTLFGNNEPLASQENATPDSTTVEYSSRLASSANRTAEALSVFAERYDKEGPKLLARKALRRIGRAVTSPARNAASAFSEKVSAVAAAGKEKLSTLVSPVQERVKLYESQPETRQEQPERSVEQAVETEEVPDDGEFYSKKSAKALDWVGEKVEGDGGKIRELVADKFYDKAVKVDNREGTYASRTGDKIRSGIDKMDALSRENDGWLRDKIAEKYAEAKERRKNRVKKQRIRTVGRKLIAYHRAGKEAAKNVKRNDHQDNFDLAG